MMRLKVAFAVALLLFVPPLVIWALLVLASVVRP
jgi:hypothetical protein